MADIKGTARQEFPEVKGKIVDRVELIVEGDFYGIDIHFHDRTALAFSFEPCVVAFPEYSDWTGGEQKPIKEFKPVRSRVSRSQ